MQTSEIQTEELMLNNYEHSMCGIATTGVVPVTQTSLSEEMLGKCQPEAFPPDEFQPTSSGQQRGIIRTDNTVTFTHHHYA